MANIIAKTTIMIKKKGTSIGFTLARNHATNVTAKITIMINKWNNYRFYFFCTSF